MKFLNTLYFKIAAGVIVAFILYLESFVNHNKDLDVFTAASRLVFEGKTCYEVWIKSGTSGLKYFYSPLFAVLLFPLKDLPQVATNLIWLILNLVVLLRTFKLLAFYLPLNNLPDTKRNVFYLLAFLASARSLYDCFSLGQMTFILLWASLEALRLIYLKQTVKGAALLALAINIKLLPIAVLVYLIYIKEIKPVILCILFLGIYLMLPGIFIGFSFNMQLHAEWLASLTKTNAGSIMDDYGRQSLSSFLPALLMDTPLQFGMKRNFVNLSPDKVNMALNMCRVLMLIVLAFLFGKPFKKPLNLKTLFYHLSLICLVSPVFFPHQGKYSFFYLMPAYACMIWNFFETTNNTGEFKWRELKNSHILTLISFVFVSLTTDGLVGRHLSDVCEYLNFITIGTLFLIVAMAGIKKQWYKAPLKTAG